MVHRKSRASLTVAAAVALGLGAADAASPQEALRPPITLERPDPVVPFDETRAAEWSRLRREFGFDGSAPLVAELHGRRGVSRLLGAPLSEAEEAEMRRRHRERQRLPAFEAELAALHPDHAGVYTDQARGGIIVALVTRRLDAAVEDRLRQRHPLRLEFRVVTHSQRELAEARRKVDRLTADDRGLGVVGIGTSVEHNRVWVGVLRLDDEVRRAFLEEFPEPVYALVEMEAPRSVDSTQDSPGPMKSGLQICAPNGACCTTGFVTQTGRSPTGYAVLTAGHCVTVGGWGNYRHANVVVGQALAHGDVPNSRADVAEIQLPWGMAGNLLWWGNDTITWVEGLQGKNDDRVNDLVCKHGAATGFNCGTLQGLCEDYLNEFGRWMRCQRRASFNADRGDSGAGVTKENEGLAAGIVSMRLAPGQTAYSHVGHYQEMFGSNVVSDWRVTPLVVRHSGQVLDVPEARLDLVQLVQWPYGGWWNQLWWFVPYNGQFYLLQNLNSWWCVDVGAAGHRDGEPIVQWGCHGGGNQQFDLVRFGGTHDFDVRARHSGKCMDVSNVSQSAGAPIHQWTCHRGNNQRWYLP